MKLPRWIRAPLRRGFFTFEQFSRHEMANHAAAGAYAFLLSALPALLLVLYALSILGKLVGFPLAWVVTLLSPYLEPFGGGELLIDLLARPLSGWAGFLGFINLVWTSRLLVLSIQRGIRIIYSSPVKRSALVNNLFTILIELVGLVILIGVVGLGQIAKFLLQSSGWFPFRRILGAVVSFSLSALVPVTLWLFTFLTYRNIPYPKPSFTQAFLSSLLAVGSYGLLSTLVSIIIPSGRYGMLYGLLGNLIGGLIRVYMFFWLYFFFAELCYILEHYDSLLFARFHQLHTKSRIPKKLEHTLFAKPERLFKQYAKVIPKGTLLFQRGDPCDEAYYLYEGNIAIYLEDPGQGKAPISLVKEGEFFGEMACILREPRTAWAMAQSDSTIFVLPKPLFKQILSQDSHAATRMVELLAARLSANNQLFRGGSELNLGQPNP
ncbi:MAG: YhjD/YihY/BrkB family envelope integrity protein [Spirochaetales bacterium]